MYTDNRDAYRQRFYQVWKKHQQQWALEPWEAQLIKVILIHPEYHSLLEHEIHCQHQEFEPEENPFIHMSLHMAVDEQLILDRPSGIRSTFQQIRLKQIDEHEAKHQLITCLARQLWEAQQSGVPADESEYLKRVKKLAESLDAI